MESQSVVPRACHNCRVRKIRCNREFPCSNCLTSNISCQPGNKGGRPAPPPAAPASTASNENNFKGLHDRLERLETALEKLSTSNAARSNKSQAIGPVPALAEFGKPWTETAAYVERDPSFERQSLMAGQFMELAVPSGSPAVANQFKALNDAVATPESDTSTARQKIRSASGAVQMDHVPANFVLQLIRYLSSFRTLLCIVHPITDLEILKSLCQKIYFPVDPVSVGDLTLFNGILSLALWEVQALDNHDIDPQEIAHYRAVCDANFSHGVESPEIAAVPTYEHTLTLALAGFTAQAKGDIVRHQAFVSAGARHCLQLGYHRDDRGQLSPEEALKRRLLFWHIYMSDMSLPLRIGRASIIQDYDVDVPLPPVWEEPGENGWCQSMRCFIKLSSLRGRIYRKLYSPRAASCSTEYRQRKIAVIAEELQQFHKDWQEIDQTKMHYSYIFQRMFMAVDVIYYSMLTLLYRGSTTSNSPADISNECFVAARQGLEAHLRIFPVAAAAGKESISYYGVWILLHSSFTPFVVTFLHCVFNSDTDDLNLLKSVLETLQEIAETSDRIERQYSLCKALYRIAEALLEPSQTAGQMAASMGSSDKTLNIPLQLTTADNWGVFDSMVEGWDAQYFGQQSLMLDNCI